MFLFLRRDTIVINIFCKDPRVVQDLKDLEKVDKIMSDVGNANPSGHLSCWFKVEVKTSCLLTHRLNEFSNHDHMNNIR